MTSFTSDHDHDPDENAAGYLAGGCHDEMQQGGDDDSVLCLRSGNKVYPVYELSKRRFAISAMTSIRQDHDQRNSPATSELEESDWISGHLFTENGEVWVPVDFRLAESDGSLLFCDLRYVDDAADPVLHDLLEVLNNDWDEHENDTDAIIREGVLFDNAAGDQVARTATSHFKAIPWKQWFKGKAAIIGIAAVAMLAVASVFSNQIFNGNPALGESQLTSAPSITAAVSPATERVPAASEKQSLETSTVVGSPVQASPTLRGIIDVERFVIRSSVAGKVSVLLVEAGQSVDAGQTIATLTTDTEGVDQRRLRAEQKLANVKLLAARAKLIEAYERVAAGKEKLNNDLASLNQELRHADGERQLASMQWKRLEPLVQNKNVGRKEAEQVQKMLSSANENYARLAKIVDQRQKILQSPQIEQLIADKLGISVVTLEADVSVAEAQLQYTEEQLEIAGSLLHNKDVQSTGHGNVQKIFVSVGDQLIEDQPICELYDAESRIVQFAAPKELAIDHPVGTRVTLRLADSESRISATVMQIDTVIGPDMAAANENTRYLQVGESTTVKLALDSDFSRLPLGTMLVWQPGLK